MISKYVAAMIGLAGFAAGAQAVVVGGVMPGDHASMCMTMQDSAHHQTELNMTGDCSVQRGSSYMDLGANRNGGSHLLGSWDEHVTGNSVYINAIFKTADGSMFMPITSSVNGQPAYYWSWNFGTNDPVDYQPWVTGVTLQAAHIYFSDNGGQSFIGAVDMFPALGPNFDPGRDPGMLLTSIGDGTNFVLLQYQIQVAPAPGGLAAMAGASMLALRRRRR
jgi:hypothetical protein